MMNKPQITKEVPMNENHAIEAIRAAAEEMELQMDVELALSIYRMIEEKGYAASQSNSEAQALYRKLASLVEQSHPDRP